MGMINYIMSFFKKEDMLPVIRFSLEKLKDTTLVCMDERDLIPTWESLYGKKMKNILRGWYDPNTNTIYTSYIKHNNNVLPDLYNVGHEIVHCIMGDTGDFIDSTSRPKGM